MVRRVVINADELGLDDSRTQGVLEAHRRGVVTSTTLLANTREVEALCAQIRDFPRLGVGVHLNLSEGEAILSKPRTLADRQGRFFGKADVRRRLMEGRLDEEEIRTEFDLQVRRIRDAGIEPSHLDSAHHVHLYPSVMSAACWVAKRHGIERIRIPREPVPAAGAVSSQVYWEIVRLQGLIPRALEILSAEGLRTTDHFRGLSLAGGIHFDRFLDVLARLPEGTSEVMVHPGTRDAGGRTFASEEREKELRVLTDPETRQAIAGYGIDLITFREI
jgi:predicted glycoside hydrolase/deacetylase ChbG (UPF0249 family)